jgi:ankyrin repeat protein
MKKKTSREKRPSVMAAVQAGDVKAVQAAVAAGVDLLNEMEDTSPLALAVEKNDAAMVEALLKLGHKPDLGGIAVPLALAARSGNTKILDSLLNFRANVSEPGEEGETAVMWAAGAGQLDAVKRLIDAGANIHQTDRGGEDALDYALNGRHAATIAYLLPHFPKSRQEKIQRQSHLLREDSKPKKSQVATRLLEAMQRPESKGKKRTAESLFRAFVDGDEKKFLQLLTAGADPNEVNKEGTTILTAVSASSSVWSLLKPLLKAGADPNRGDLLRPLDQAATKGAESVRLLIEAGADVNWADADGGTALMSAAAVDDAESIRLLLAAGANPNAEDHKGHTAFWFALDGNNDSATEVLEPLTADAGDAKRPWRKNKEGKSHELCFLDAVEGGDEEYAKRLLAEGVAVDAADSSGDTALHKAAKNGDITTLQTLLAAGAPINAEGGGDLTPLLASARNGKMEIVRTLLHAGAEVQAKKGTVLCEACEGKDRLELVELLLQAGAKVNVVGGWRRVTPLHVATEFDQLLVVKRLLQAGAKVATKDPNGWTPFLNAALRSRVEVVQTLIDAGSDIKAVDREGRDAYELASKWGKREVAEFLKPLLRK